MLLAKLRLATSRTLPPVIGNYLLLWAAAFVAGAINSIAGGGTLITFPALVSVLGSNPVSQVIANATNTVRSARVPPPARGPTAESWGRPMPGFGCYWCRASWEGSPELSRWSMPRSRVFALLVPWLILGRL